MAVAARPRELTAGEYLTDGSKALLYMLEVDPRGRAMVEDVRTLEVYRIKVTALDGWRVVTPDGA